MAIQRGNAVCIMGCVKERFLGLEGLFNFKVPYESPILGQLLDLISPTKINLFEPRFKSYDPWDMAN